MRLKSILYILALLPMLWSCNNEDDIQEIFVSGTWNVGNFYTGGNWDKTNKGGIPRYTKEEDLKILNQMMVAFLDNGTVQGRTTNGTFTAEWDANGKERTVRIFNIKTTTPPTGKGKEFIEALQEATYYKGDSNYLKLASDDKKTYIQLGHYSK